jgi:hypothetical protein
MKKTLAELMPEEEGNDNKTKNEKTCRTPTLGIQQVSILRTKKPAKFQPLEFNRYQFLILL